MDAKRSPWIIPVVVALVAMSVFLGAVLMRGSIDASELLGGYFTYLTLFLVFAVIAVVVYRSLKRSHRAP